MTRCRSRHGVIRIFAPRSPEKSSPRLRRYAPIGPATSASIDSGITPATAGQPHRRANPHQRLMRRRSANRIARYRCQIQPVPDSPRSLPPYHRSTRPVTRSSAYGFLVYPGKIEVDRLIRTERPLRHIRLRQHKRGPASLNPLHQKRIALRQEPGECERPHR